MEDCITRREHDEFCKRMEDEHRRINRRLGNVEELTRSVATIAQNTETILKNQEKQEHRIDGQDERIDVLEHRDGEKWRKVTGYIVTTAAGIIVGFLFKQIGM